MTKKWSDMSDNNGLCESCNDPSTKNGPQSTYPVFLGGGLGWGTMWLCPVCLEKSKKRDEERKMKEQRHR